MKRSVVTVSSSIFYVHSDVITMTLKRKAVANIQMSKRLDGAGHVSECRFVVNWLKCVTRSQRKTSLVDH